MMRSISDLFHDPLNRVWLLLALTTIWCSLEGLIP